MDGVEILGTMAAEGAPWWVFLGLGLICVAILALAFTDTDRSDAALFGFMAVLCGFLLGALTQQITPERQIALVTDEASYVAIEERYKVTKIDEHLYFLEVKEE